MARAIILDYLRCEIKRRERKECPRSPGNKRKVKKKRRRKEGVFRSHEEYIKSAEQSLRSRRVKRRRRGRRRGMKTSRGGSRRRRRGSYDTHKFAHRLKKSCCYLFVLFLVVEATRGWNTDEEGREKKISYKKCIIYIYIYKISICHLGEKLECGGSI